MYRFLSFLVRSLFLLLMIESSPVFAMLSMELTRGVSGAIPIAIVPFQASKDLSENVSNVIINDLKNSGRFKIYEKSKLSQFPHEAKEISPSYFRRLGSDHVVIGKVLPQGAGHYQVNFQLINLFGNAETHSILLNQTYRVNRDDLRSIAHHMSDLIYKELVGIRGIFSTKIAYVVVQRGGGRGARYILEIADQDGYNPRPLLNSPEPIMSPAWSPNGKQIAYVSFENHHSSIYLQELATGKRRLLSQFEGINGAPAWSYDGKKLALVLSKSGAPNIYVMDIASKKLTPITHDFYINTEPAWSPNGKSLLFTSNRGGGPQLYMAHLNNGNVSRLSFEGDYNARGSFTRDGKYVAMIHRVASAYKIGFLNLDTGTLKVLSGAAADNSSPSIAPNNSMILFDTVSAGRNMLSMVSSDGKVQLMLPSPNGEAQDPAWSPFLS